VRGLVWQSRRCGKVAAMPAEGLPRVYYDSIGCRPDSIDTVETCGSILSSLKGPAMCMEDNCTPGDLDRRTFLAGGAGGLASLAASRVALELSEPAQRRPETRVLDLPELRDIEHGKVLFRSGDKE